MAALKVKDQKSQLAFTFVKSTIETVETGMKCVQTWQ